MPVLLCPGCGRKLQIADNLIGKTIRCPDCSNTFLAQTEAPLKAKVIAAPSKASKARIVDDDLDDDDDEPRGGRGRREKKNSNNTTLYILLGIGGLGVFLLIGIVVAVFAFSGSRKDVAMNTAASQQPNLTPQPINGLPTPVPFEPDVPLSCSELDFKYGEDSTHYLLQIVNNSRDFEHVQATLHWRNFQTPSAQGRKPSAWKQGESLQFKLSKRDNPVEVRLEGFAKTSGNLPTTYTFKCEIPNPAGVNPNLKFPPLGPANQVEAGITAHRTIIKRESVPMEVLIYVPQKAAGKLPCVLTGPAGTTLLTGTKVGEGDKNEQLQYVRAGFVVVSFDLDGPELGNRATDKQILASLDAFRKADAGVANARAALDFALEKIPNIDADRVSAAGHSSAATLALLFASKEPRIKACAAYAPVTDVAKRLAPATPALSKAYPGFADFLRESSPRTHIDKLKCPVFMFYAVDDDVVPTTDSSEFAKDLAKINTRVTLYNTAHGGHYDSMIKEGVPLAIKWFKKLDQ